MGRISLIEYLNSPHLVARFQGYFGVHRPASPAVLSASNNDPEVATKKFLQLHKHQAENIKETTDSDYEFDMGDERSNSGSKYVKAGTSLKKRQNHTRNESSGSSGVSSSVEDEEDDGEVLQFVTNKLWYYLFLFGTGLGDEIFYSCWFSFWFWNVDGAVGRRVVLVWAILMYVGQGLKDIIRWPRPSCPPVVRLEKKWEKEYGMPSTHAVVGAAVPFSTIIFTASRYQYPIEAGITVAVIWCTLVCTSRLYLGMHSVLDIVAGLSLVAVLFVPVIPLVDWLDPIILKTEYGGLGILIAAIVLCFFTPGGDRWTPARGDTFVILGSSAGLMIGACLNYQFGIIRGPPLDPPYAIIWPSYAMLGLSLLRLIIGLCMVVATRAIVKSFLHTAFHSILKVPKKADLNDASKTEVFVELSQKFLCYVAIGLNVVFLSPAVFRLIGIERPTFHTEI